MQHKYGHAAWMWKCNMDIIDMQHGDKYGNAVWTYNIYIQHKMLHGPTAWTHSMETWTCSIDMDMQLRREHAAWIFKSSMGMDIYMQHGYGPSTDFYCTYSTDMDMKHGHEYAASP